MADFLHQTYNIFSSFATYPFQLLPHCFPPTFKHFAVQIIPYGFLGSICYILDVIFLAIQHRILRALVDNMAHGVIAFLSWCVVSEVLTRKDLADGVLSAFIACALDVDHFIAARSFNLQNALHLKNRPFLHSTTTVFILVPILQVWIAQNVSSLRSLPYVFAVSVISHHLRDGHRRGLWFWPFGSTPPLPYWVYITCTLVTPYFVKEIKSSIAKFNVISISKPTGTLMDV